MDERELEQQLRRRLHARFDGGRPSEALRLAVSRSLTPDARRGGRFSLAAVRSTGPLLLAAAAVVAIAVVIVINRPSGPVGIGTETPSPSASSTATPSGAPPSAPPSAPATPNPSAMPPATVPPASTGAWTGVDVARLTGAPTGMAQIVSWAGGYVGIATPATGGASRAWTSPDGRSWSELPADTFRLDDPTGSTLVEAGTRCADRALVFTVTGTGPTDIVWSSSDGTSWTSTTLAGQWRGAMAGGPGGAITPAGTGLTVDVTTDCTTWQAATLPGPAQGVVTGVAAFGGGFVAVGFSGTYDSGNNEPLAWWSPDGTHWTAATVPARTGEGLIAVQAGSAGLTAESTQPGVIPGVESMWTSTDGRTWSPSTANPLGTLVSGQGVGSIAGSPTGDGIHLLVWGSQGGGGGPVEYWTSLDGAHWTKLTLTGTGAAGVAADPTVGAALMRDGILFSGDSGTWFGTAVGP